MRLYLSLFGFLIVSLVCSSCNNEDEDIVYSYGITSASTSDNMDIQTIETAYCDSYKENGIVFNANHFTPNTPKRIILKSCEEAEKAIRTSNHSFKGRYVYEVRSHADKIYSQTWGVRE